MRILEYALRLNMATSRITVTVDTELEEVLRRVSSARGVSISALVSEAIAQELRYVALEEFLDHAEREFGPISQGALDEADRIIDRALTRGVPKKSAKTSKKRIPKRGRAA
jgi:post-segregation antitoxin (ccd killing protein)